MRTHRVAGEILIVALTSLALVGCASDKPDDQIAEKRAASESVLEVYVPDDEIPGCSAAVAVDGEVVWSNARGIANMDTTAPFETTTPIHIGSVSKQFTAMAVLMLAERGELSLDDSPSDYLDGLPAWAESLTIDDLIHHTSGIKDFESVPRSTFGAEPVTNPDILEWVKTGENMQSGNQGYWSYSNTNYNLLADIVTEVTGEKFSVWADANVLAPMGLELRLWPREPGDAVGYQNHMGEFTAADAGSWVDEGSGGVLITPSDLAHWGDHIRTSTIVSAATFDEAIANAVSSGGDKSYGPGLITRADGSLYHGGVGEGEYTAFSVSPDRHTTFAVACNQDGIDPDGIYLDLQGVWLGETADRW